MNCQYSDCAQFFVMINQLPRMADFAKWGCAASPALGSSPSKFLAAYAANQRSANSLVLEASPLVPLIRQVVRQRPDHRWAGTASELLVLLNSYTVQWTGTVTDGHGHRVFYRANYAESRIGGVLVREPVGLTSGEL